MKRLLVTLNIISLCVVSLLLLKGCSTDPKGDSTTEKAVSNTSNKDDIVLNYADSTFKSLTVVQAKIMKNAYVASEAAKAGVKPENFEYKDTELIHYSLNELKNLVWYIEHHTNGTNLGISPDSLGVNFYFAKYPDLQTLNKYNYEIDDKKKEIYANRTTIFMVPTVKHKGQIVEFDPKKNHDERPKSIISLLDHYKYDFSIYKPVNYKDGAPIANLGNMQPPPVNN